MRCRLYLLLYLLLGGASSSVSSTSIRRPHRLIGGASLHPVESPATTTSLSPPLPHHSFAEDARRAAEENAAAARDRAGSLSPYLHSSGHMLDFGCGRQQCRCTLLMNAGFHELQVEGARLLAEQRLQESAACYSQAIDLYLARIGRYYVDKSGSSGDRHTDKPLIESSSSSSSTSSNLPVPLGLSPGEVADAHARAQEIVDALNRGPKEGWSLNRRSKSHQRKRVEELAQLTKKFEVDQAAQEREENQKNGNHQQQSDSSTTPTRHRLWTRADELNSTHMHEVAQTYANQLRQRWMEWEQEASIKRKKRKAS